MPATFKLQPTFVLDESSYGTVRHLELEGGQVGSSWALT
jgi:hypothetical protein